MSQETVEIVRRLMEAFERRDPEATFAILDPAVVWDASNIAYDPLVGVYHGHEGVRDFWRQWLGPFEEHHAEVLNLIDAGDSVVLQTRLIARGRASGIAVDMHRWAVHRFGHGRIVHVQIFDNEAEALEAAGLKE
jgi:ketosteroid isomerase-like protein